MKKFAILISSLFLMSTTCKKKGVDTTNNQVVQETVKDVDGSNNNTDSSSVKELVTSESVKVEEINTNPTTENSQNSTIVKQDNGTVVEYEALSRGMFLKVKYANGLVNVFNDRNNSEKSTSIQLTKVQADELNKLLGTIKPEKLETMQAPSQARLYDGAALANMTITTKGKTYSCPGFDHGQPPAGIEKFVKKLLSYTEKK
ncbi:MAG: hypothetical protein QM535_07760 [Limnohabitans sp.]|nr:hypothetical protein [Limnohabitans sp.]